MPARPTIARIDLRALAYVGAQTEVRKLAEQIRTYVTEFPLLKDFAVQQLGVVAGPKPARKAAAAAVTGRKLTDAGRAKLRANMRRRWKAVKAAGGTSLKGKGAK